MQTDFNLPPPEASKPPAISIIIPMYNREKYIGECLESILAQTFLDFEVIVIDDCSTDSSLEVAKSYVERSGGRIKLAMMKKNSGNPGRPRNVGLQLASGEYILFVDSDDFIAKNALETLYNAAKKYDAEVVYYAAHYYVKNPDDVQLHRDGFALKLIKDGLEDKPTLTVNDPDKLLREALLMPEGYLSGPCTKFARRDFLTRNGITFPNVTVGEDFIWCINIYCRVKRFLRIPTPLYFYRRYDTQSVSRVKKEPSEQVSHWITEFTAWLRFLNELASKNEILLKNPAYCLAASKNHFQWLRGFMSEAQEQLSDEEIYKILFNEFTRKNDYQNLIVPFFLSVIHADKKALDDDKLIINKLTSRIDIKFVPKTGAGDFQILSVSDDKAEIRMPDWLQAGGAGYQIQSYAGNIKIVVKAAADGQLILNLRGLDIRTPEDQSKRIPCWIDYTKLVINGNVIFDKVTPAWHDEPYNCNLDIKAGNEITLQVEWLPHKSKPKKLLTEQKSQGLKIFSLLNAPTPAADNMPAISIIIPMYNREKYICECLDCLLAQTLQNFEVIVIDDCSTDNSVAVVAEYAERFNGRLKLAKMEKNTGHPGEPRNVGISLAAGEYIYCLDSDDAITATALEEIYTLGKKFDADVIYCEKYYMSEGFGQEFKDNIRIADSRIQKPPFVEEPTLETNNLPERVKALLNWNYWISPALKLVSRNLLMDNNITFPSLVGSEDDIWSMQIFFCSKRFLRIPNICFIKRMHEEGISFGQYPAHVHIQRWADVVIRNLKALDDFMQGFEFFTENPRYRYDVLSRSVRNAFAAIFEKCANISPFDVYKIFQEKFGDYLGEHDVLVSSLCAYMVELQKRLSNQQKKSEQEYRQLISAQEEEIKQLKEKVLSLSTPLPALMSTQPAISVIIPMYNSEKYIGECLNSLFKQSFRNFEVIVVDDCSTDNSRAIVEIYEEKFGGRLRLVTQKQNTGAGSARNKGLSLSQGEYVYFMDSDDKILENALADLYALAKNYDADVVYSGAYYVFSTANDADLRRDKDCCRFCEKRQNFQPVLTVNNPHKNLQWLFDNGTDFWKSWTKFIKRDFLVKNSIAFPEITSGGDFIWTIEVLCNAERFLRVSNAFYFYRNTTSPTPDKQETVENQIAAWGAAFVSMEKALKELSDKVELLQENPVYCYSALNLWLQACLSGSRSARYKVDSKLIYEILKKNVAADSMLPFIFSALDLREKETRETQEQLTQLKKEVESLKQGKE